MTTRASADNRFNRRNIIIAVVGLAIGLWGAYDAFIAYPKKLKQSEAFEEIVEYVHANKLESKDLSEKWQETTTKKGWSRERPKPSAELRGTIIFNYWLVVVGLLICLFFLIKFFRMRNSWLESDGKKISTSWGQSIDLEKVLSLNKVKWEKKGIAKLAYADDSGNEKQMTLDDFKYERKGMGEIMQMIEKGLKPDQIKLPFSEAEDAYEDADEAEADKAEADEAEDDKDEQPPEKE